ncbi:DEAD/DEAH box helicase [Cytobacillus oceanisediminis]|uniref:DEAD/DEAH box helicase n=1 Tax=Cytobacillus oceanisediminis TaxID=665099 RepID=UPI00203D361D|nr:DEAD/DEAH box helicase [Cytobacillus oceanisediminis]MCM3530228.1 DEAD/DEAH box helicase [Cytobacillus oceanisediminis]
MPFLQCSCGSLLKGYQLSRKVLSAGEYRLCEYKVGAALEASSWRGIDEANEWMKNKDDAVYCPKCHNEIPIDPAEVEVLLDKRISGLSSSEFDSIEVIEKLKQVSQKERAEIFVHSIPESDPVFGEIHDELPESLRRALKQMNIESLFTHQADTYNAVRKKKDVVLVTQTASGKTLSFNLPILHGLLENENARALYIFPTKALADDQVEQLYRWTGEKVEDDSYEQDEWFERTIRLGSTNLPYGRLDGDTQPGSRKRLLKDGRILFTNPDMIHHSILRQVQGNHQTSNHVCNLLKNLKYIVIDEMHLYRGAFGSHVSLVIRRLRKICEELGNRDIQFILCSATIENPKLLAEELTGKSEFTLVDNDGSSKRKRHIVFWNPGVTLDTGVRKAPVSDAISIAENVLVHEEKIIRTIMFQGSRLQGKVTARSMKDVLRKKLKLKKENVAGVQLSAFYNGMLGVDERKQVINAIKKSDVHLVIATNALEVGIDIGDLSFAILSGYPGSKAAFSQQIGRVGRKGEGVAVMIFEDEPLQQYYMQNPNTFLEKPPEVVRIDPRNAELLKLHLAYLQDELGRPLSIEDLKIFLVKEEVAKQLLENLEPTNEEELPRSSLRSGSLQSYKVVVTKSRDVLLESIDEWTAFRDFHEGAIYWNANEKGYRVDSINRKKLEILVTPIRGEIEYYTQSIFKDFINVSEGISVQESQKVIKSTGILNIKRSIFGFNKSYFGSRVPDVENLNPPLVADFDAEGMWIVLSDELIQEVKGALGSDYSEEKLDGSIRAAEHVLLSVIPDTIICDANDISGFSGLSVSGFANKPVIGFYGNQSGGMGTTKAIGEHMERISKSAIHLLNNCSCSGGCPSCIQYPGKDNDHLSKIGAKAILLLLSYSIKNILKGAELNCL